MRYYRMKTVIFAHSALRDLEALPSADRSFVEDAIYRYATTGRGDVKKLSGRDFYRLRAGRYRVVFGEDRVTIVAVYVGKRDTTTYGRF